MNDYPVFKNPPIVEAILDIQVLLPSDTSLATLASVQEPVKERYPDSQEREYWQINATDFGNGSPNISQSGGVVGYMFLPSAPVQDRAFQSLMSNFTFSKLPPYTNWGAFRAEAEELWDVYGEITGPIEIKRLGLRTINRLNLPLPFGDLKEYILTVPEVATGIASGLAQFAMSIAIPQPHGELAVVTLAMQPLQPNTSFVTIIFDIDVSFESNIAPNSDAIWQRFESLRRIRNDIFFCSLTDKAKGLF